MKKYVMSLALSLVVLATLAAQKKDTVVLSVYNNNQRFMLYPMPFGKNKPDKNFTADMVLSLDTVHRLEVATKRDSSGKFPKLWVTTRQCGKLPTNVKDKVALLELNAACDISTQVLNAQNAGALAVVVIHTTNSTDSVILPKLTGQQRYVDANKVKIPCFTVRNVIGDKLKGMLPSLVGIRRPDSIGVIQALTQQTPPAASTDKQASATSVKAAAANQTSDGNIDGNIEENRTADSPTFKGIGWDMAPNPANNDVTLNYNFKEPNALKIDIFNEIGQLVTNYQLPDAQTGKLTINVAAFQDGEYNVRLISGKFMEVKRLIVVH